MRYYTFYISGALKQHRPGAAHIVFTRKGIKMFGASIPWENVQKSEVSYEVIDKATSAGGAVAGAVLAGGVGAVIGGMAGGKKVNMYTRITYHLGDKPKELLVTGYTAETVNKVVNKRIASKKLKVDMSAPKLNASSAPKRGFLYWYFSMYRWTFGLIKKVVNKG